MVIKNSDNYFYVCNENVLKSMEDLLELLKTIDDDSLECHFNAEKNDFSNWTREILKEKTLSKKLDKSKDKEEMIVAIEQRIKEKEKKKKKSRKNIILKIKGAIANE